MINVYLQQMKERAASLYPHAVRDSVQSECARSLSDMYKIYANTPDSLKKLNVHNEKNVNELRKRKLKMSLDLYSFLK